MARAMGYFEGMKPRAVQDTTGPPPIVRVAVYVGNPPVADEEWIGDLIHAPDSDQLYYQLYGRFPE